MSARDSAIVGELVGLLSARGEAPRSAVECIELVQYVAETLPQHERVAERLAWRLVESAVMERDAEEEAHRPLMAAKHLLALGMYPEDIETEARASVDEIQLSKPRSNEMDPYRWITVRRKIAARAGGYGVDPSNLNPSHKGRRLSKVAEAVWVKVQELAQDPERLTELVVVTEDPFEAMPAARSSASREVAIRRLRRIHRNRLLTKLRHKLPGFLFNLSLILGGAFAVWLVTATAIVLNVLPTTEEDPLAAAEAGVAWPVGLGPSESQRAATSAANLEVNPMQVAWPLSSPTAGDFVDFDADYEDYMSTQSLAPGTHTVTVRIRTVLDDDKEKTGGVTSGASIQLGILPTQRTGSNLGFYARISADGIGPIWDGEPFLLSCDCSIAIDPDSIRLYSDAIPDGVALGEAALEATAPIGFLGADGALRSGFLYQSRVVADIVVTERDWQG